MATSKRPASIPGKAVSMEERIQLDKLNVLQSIVDLPKELEGLKLFVQEEIAKADYDYQKEIATFETKKRKLQEEYDVKLVALEEEYEKKESKLEKNYQAKLSSYELSNEVVDKWIEEGKYQEHVDSLQSKIDAETKRHDRELEELKYEHKIAIEREKKEALEALLKLFKLEAVNKGYPQEIQTELESIKASLEEANATIVDQNKKLQGLYIEQAKWQKEEKEENKYHALELSSRDALIKRQENEIRELKEQLAKVPQQIKDAVAAAKADVTVNQDAAKK